MKIYHTNQNKNNLSECSGPVVISEQIIIERTKNETYCFSSET